MGTTASSSSTSSGIVPQTVSVAASHVHHQPLSPIFEPTAAVPCGFDVQDPSSSLNSRYSLYPQHAPPDFLRPPLSQEHSILASVSIHTAPSMISATSSTSTPRTRGRPFFASFRNFLRRGSTATAAAVTPRRQMNQEPPTSSSAGAGSDANADVTPPVGSSSPLSLLRQRTQPSASATPSPRNSSHHATPVNPLLPAFGSGIGAGSGLIIPNPHPTMLNSTSSSIPAPSSHLAASKPLALQEMADRLRPFQPHCLRSQILDIQKECVQMEGAIAFVDISGFSALANLLNQDSKGAMVLSEYLSEYMSPLIGLVHDAKGDIVTFAGDAFVAMWTTDSSADWSGTTKLTPLLSAIQCTLAMQARFNRYRVPGTDVVLKIHIGIAYGCFMGLLLNSVAVRRRLHLVLGRPMKGVGQAVTNAESGQVCLTADAHHIVKNHVLGSRLLDGTFIVTEIKSSALSQQALQDSPRAYFQAWDAPTHATFEEFLPAVILDHLKSAPLGLSSATIALQRFVAVLFLGQSEIHYSDVEAVKNFAVSALEVVIRNEGEVLQVLQDDKGLHLIAVFGISAATDTPAIPAVQSALEMLASPHINADIPCQIGIATGNVFCGIVGSERRKAFDVLGDTVNLACRLMQLCVDTHRSFLCDEATASNCSGKFFFTRLPKAYPLKGQAAPLRVCTVQDSTLEYEQLGLDVLRKRLQVHGITVCGRHQERALLDSAIRNAVSRFQKSVAEAKEKARAGTGDEPQQHQLNSSGNLGGGGVWSDSNSSNSGGRRSTVSGSRTFSPSHASTCPSSSSSSFYGGKPASLKLCTAGGASGGLSLSDGSAPAVPATPPMIVFEGQVGFGRTMLAVDTQNQWPLLPVVVASVSEYDRGAFSTFRYVVSALIAWIRLYADTCKINPTSDEDIIQQLLPGVEFAKLVVLNSLLCTHFANPVNGRKESAVYEKVSGGDQSNDEASSLGHRRGLDRRALKMEVLPEESQAILGLLLRMMIQNFCSRVALCVLCYDDAHFMDPQSQDLVDELHTWATETSPQPRILQVLFVESGSVTVLPKGSIRHELHDLSVYDIRDFLYHALEEASSAVESDIFPDDLCYLIGKKVSYNPLMMAELSKIITSPEVLKGVQTDQRGEVRFSPKALAEILHYDFSSSQKITMMVAHGFDCLDAPQQILVKAASVILAHPEARLYKPQLYHLLDEFPPHVVDAHFDWLLARRLLVVDSSGQGSTEEWRRLLRYKFSLECFGVVMTSLMSPTVLQNMNSRLSELMLSVTLIDSAVNYDILSHYLYMGKLTLPAAKFLIRAIDAYAADEDLDSNMGETRFRAASGSSSTGGGLFLRGGPSGLVRASSQSLESMLRMKVLEDRLRSLLPSLGTDDRILSKLAIECLERRDGAPKPLAMVPSPQSSRNATLTTSISSGAEIAVESTGITDLDAAARRLLVALSRVEQRVQFSKAAVNAGLWRQFLDHLEGYQRIQQVVVGQISSDHARGLRVEEINEVIGRLNTANVLLKPLTSKTSFRGLSVTGPSNKTTLPGICHSPTRSSNALTDLAGSSSSANTTPRNQNKGEEEGASHPKLLKFDGVMGNTASADPASATVSATESILPDLRKLRGLLNGSVAAATAAAKAVLKTVPVTAANFVWQDAFLIGIPMVDLQHKQLFVIMTHLSEVAFATDLSASTRHTRLSKVLKWLLEYTLFHFLAEEVLMRRITYPQFAQHRCVHQSLTSTCLDIQAKFNEGALAVDGSLLAVLFQWLLVHIGHSDKHFGSYYVAYRATERASVDQGCEDLLLATQAVATANQGVE